MMCCWVCGAQALFGLPEAAVTFVCFAEGWSVGLSLWGFWRGELRPPLRHAAFAAAAVALESC